jgi:predicted metal-dependent HD superfamily phosphohydrolase
MLLVDVYVNVIIADAQRRDNSSRSTGLAARQLAGKKSPTVDGGLFASPI